MHHKRTGANCCLVPLLHKPPHSDLNIYYLNPLYLSIQQYRIDNNFSWIDPLLASVPRAAQVNALNARCILICLSPGKIHLTPVSPSKDTIDTCTCCTAVVRYPGALSMYTDNKIQQWRQRLKTFSRANLRIHHQSLLLWARFSNTIKITRIPVGIISACMA